MGKSRRWGMQARVSAKGWLARAKQVLTTEPGQGPDAGREASARALASEARRMKGGVGKTAQLAGYLEAFDLEQETQRALAGLWDHMEPASSADVEAAVAAELGAPPDTIFGRWQSEPFAAASLGQVHGAWSHDGIEYAVKVQYPDVAAALADDLNSDSLVRQLAGVLGARLSPSAIESLRATMVRELDYRAEAKAAARFADAFAGDPDIVIPAVDVSRSSARVLTMQRMHGLPLIQVATGPAELRALAAAVIVRFAWSAPLRHGLVHGDPNPGNYLVLPGPPVRVAFLDFGCVTEIEPDTVEGERTLWRALLCSNKSEAAEGFRHALHTLDMVPNLRSFYDDGYREWEELITAPVRQREAFAWTARYAAHLLDVTRRAVAIGLLQIPPHLVLLWRQRLGIAAVLAMLDVPVDSRAALEQVLAEPIAP